MFKRPSDIDRLVKASKGFRSSHRSVVARMAEGYILCANCQTEIKLDKTQVENYLRAGWPKCCVGTLKGGTMQFIRRSA